jgi:hypothetical protein
LYFIGSIGNDNEVKQVSVLTLNNHVSILVGIDLLVYFVTNNAAYGSSADRTCRAASGQDRTTYGADTGTHGRVLVPSGHARAACQGENRADSDTEK